MQKTLLLALIATAVTACNKSASEPGTAKAPNNVRKLPLRSGHYDEDISKRVTGEDPALAH